MIDLEVERIEALLAESYAVEAPVSPLRGAARVEALGSPGSFRVVCCQELLRVEGADASLWSYHLRHAWGGLIQTCRGCGASYALSGHARAYGLPDVVDLARLDSPGISPLTPLQAHLLDVALRAEDAIWERTAQDERVAVYCQHPEAKPGAVEVLCHYFGHDADPSTVDPAALRAGALRLRSWLQAQKRTTLRLIAAEHGHPDGFPLGTRIFRDADRKGWIQWPTDDMSLLEEIMAETQREAAR